MKPDVFAFVMATGIVSIAAADHGLHAISVAFLVVAAVALPVLIAMAVKRLRHWDFRDADVTLGLFTYVAACAVVAARLSEHRVALWVLGGMALQGWLALLPAAARRLWPQRARAHGGWELASVATSGLAIVSADLDMVFWAVVFWLLGLAVYLLMTGLIVRRVDLAQPDSWILMGAAAIATLAGEHLHRVLPPGPLADAVRAATIVTWIVATVWLAPLAYAAVRRFVRVDWPMVFPLGMYSSASYAMFRETGWPWLTTVSVVFFWVALAAWTLTAAGATSRRVRGGGRRRRPAAPARPGR